MTRRAIDPDRGQTAEMFDLGFSAETDRPAKSRVGNQSEISEVSRRKQIGIDLDECAQDAFGNYFRAHRAVEKKIEIVRGPFRNLGGIDFRLSQLISRGRSRGGCDAERDDREDFLHRPAS